jgi:hypothetical protein
MKTRMALEVLDVLDLSGGEIVDDVNFVASGNISVTQMRSNETSTTCD